MNLKRTSMVATAMIASTSSHAAPLTDAEAAFLSHLVTAAAVLEQRCTGFEADGTGSVRLGASLLGSPAAAMDMINAFDAAIKANDGNAYDSKRFRPEVLEAARRTFKQVRSDLIDDPEPACANYGAHGVMNGVLRRY